MPSADRSSGRGSVLALVARALLAHDLPGATAEEQVAAAQYVESSVAAMPDSTRFGVRMTGAAVYGLLSVLGGTPYRALSAERRTAVAVRLFQHPLPLLGEFATLARGLALVGAVEARTREPEVSQAP